MNEIQRNMADIIEDKTRPMIQTMIENVDELAEALTHHVPNYSAPFLRDHIMSQIVMELRKSEVRGRE